jgi:hypothetical protein
MPALDSTHDPHAVGCRWFWAWAAFGAAATLACLSLGVLAAPPLVTAGWLLAARRARRRSAFGILSGAGLMLVYVAWLQRAGPGTTCWQSGTASGCGEQLNPLPWLAAGVALFAAGIVGHARRW